MRIVVFFLVTLMAIPTTASLSVAVTELSAVEAMEMGISLNFKDPNTYFPAENSIGIAPLFITLEPSPYSACEVTSVFLTVRDSNQRTLFAASIEQRLGRYDFHLLSDYLDASTLRIECSSGSAEKLHGLFEYNVGESIRFP